MTKTEVTENLKKDLLNYLNENPECELLDAYLFFIQKKFNLQPVLYPKNKVIYRSPSEAIDAIETESKVWNETEIKVTFGGENVNEYTTKIYICPFTGKVFGNNTHPNPQDAIYDWVSKCPENQERIGGLRAKRFFVSEDPEVIKSYAEKTKPKAPITKKVFSSSFSGKLFNTKNAVVEDFKKNYLKKMSLNEVQRQDKFKIEEGFLEFIQDQLSENKVTAYIESLADQEGFQSHIERWLS